MTRRDWYDAPSTVSPLSAATLNDLEARKPEISTLPINLLEPPYNCVVTTNDPGAGIRAQNVTGLNLAIAQANTDRRMILAPPGDLWYTAGATITTLDPAPGIMGTPGTLGSAWHFDKDGDCIVAKGLFKQFSGLYLSNDNTTFTSSSAVLRIKNCAYGKFENLYTAVQGTNSVGTMLEQEYFGTELDAFMLVHLGCWYNTFINCHNVYRTSGVNTGYGLSLQVSSSAVSVVNPAGQPAGTYTGAINHNQFVTSNLEGKLRGINLDRASQNIFIGGHHIGSATQTYGRNISSGNTFMGVRHTGWATLPFDLDSSCTSNVFINPILYDPVIPGPYSMGNIGGNPTVIASPEYGAFGLTLSDLVITRGGTNFAQIGVALVGQSIGNGANWAEFKHKDASQYAVTQTNGGYVRLNAPSGQEVSVTVNEVDKIRSTNTGVAVNGNAPVAKAAAITSPTTPSAGYVQAEAASMKTAVDAIRTALANFGITA